MSEIQNNNKIATVGYLSKVLTPIVTLVKNVKTEVMNVFSLPKGGTAGQVLAKTSDVDGEAEWVDLSASGALDDAPTQDSENAVKSGGVYAALENKQDELVGVAGQIVGFDADGHAVAQDAATAALPAGVEGQYIGYDVDGNAVAADMDGVPTENSAVAITSGAVFTAMAGKQDTLVGMEGQHVVFDADGKAVAADMPADHLTREVVDALPAPADAVETVIYVLKVVDPDTAAVSYEEYLLVEGALVRMSGEPVDLSNYQEKLVGLENQYVGFDVNGNAVAIDLPVGHLVREVVDALPLVDDASEDVIYILKVVDPDDATVTYEQWQLIEGAFAQVGGAPVELPENHLTREVVDALPAAADALETVMYVLRVTDADTGAVTYTEHQLIDGAMVQTSADLSGYQEKLTGNAGQMIVIDANGDAVAQDFPEGMLTREVVDVLPDVADAEENVTYILKKDDGAGNITYSEWQLIDGELVQVGGEVTDMSAYQLKLVGLEGQHVVFDADGKAVAADMPTGHLTREVVDALPAEADASEAVVYVLKVTDVDSGTVSYQEWILVDGVFVQTSGAAVDLSDYQKKIVGAEGQHVVFDAAGELIAADMPEGHLTREIVDALPGVDDAAEDVVYILKVTDPDTAAVSYEEWVFVEGAMVQTSGAAVDPSGKQDVLTGTETQFVGFDADGTAVAREISEIVDEAKTYTDEQINLAAHLKREIVTVDPTTLADTNEHTIYMYKVDSATGADVYQEWMVIDGAMTLIGDTSTTIDLSGKQDVLAGTEGQLVGFDATGAAVAVTPDIVPTEDSELPITSGAVYEALANIDVLPAGTEGQYIGFDATGAAVAVDLPEGHLVREVVDALPNAADADEAVVYILKTVDADTGDVSYEQYQLIDGAMALVGHELPDMSGYQAKLTGVAGQVVGFDADGNAVAQDAATASLPTGTEGQYLGYDADGNVVAMDLPEDIDAETINAATSLTVGGRSVYYGHITTGVRLGFTANSTVTPAEFLTALWTKYGIGTVAKIIWAYAEQITISDGTTSVSLRGGFLIYNGVNDPNNNTYSDHCALYIPMSGTTVYQIYAYTQDTAGVFAGQGITAIGAGTTSTSGTYSMIIPTSQPTSLQAGAIWLTT